METYFSRPPIAPGDKAESDQLLPADERLLQHTMHESQHYLQH